MTRNGERMFGWGRELLYSICRQSFSFFRCSTSSDAYDACRETQISPQICTEADISLVSLVSLWLLQTQCGSQTFVSGQMCQAMKNLIAPQIIFLFSRWTIESAQIRVFFSPINTLFTVVPSQTCNKIDIWAQMQTNFTLHNLDQSWGFIDQSSNKFDIKLQHCPLNREDFTLRWEVFTPKSLNAVFPSTKRVLRHEWVIAAENRQKKHDKLYFSVS